MQREDYLEQLGTNSLGRPLVWSEVVDSTNTQAMQAALAGEAGHGAVFIAGRQTAGRGTDGNAWSSAQPTGLWMSLVLRSDTAPPSAITLMPGIAIARTLREKWGIDAHLKWPNDVMVGHQKIAGILVESVAQAAGMISVIGIGVNLNQEDFAGDLKAIAISARMVIERSVPLPVFFGQLMREIEACWNRPGEWVSQWCALSRMVGSEVELKTKESVSRAVVSGLTPEGHLAIRDAQGQASVIISRTGLDVRLILDGSESP